MAERRNLSGIFFRQRNDETGKFENVCFEELREEEKKRILEERPPEWKDQLIMMLVNTLNEIGDKFDLYKG